LLPFGSTPIPPFTTWSPPGFGTLEAGFERRAKNSVASTVGWCVGAATFARTRLEFIAANSSALRLPAYQSRCEATRPRRARESVAHLALHVCAWHETAWNTEASLVNEQTRVPVTQMFHVKQSGHTSIKSTAVVPMSERWVDGWIDDGRRQNSGRDDNAAAERG
jgi:hypothetical protein